MADGNRLRPDVAGQVRDKGGYWQSRRSLRVSPRLTDPLPLPDALMLDIPNPARQIRHRDTLYAIVRDPETGEVKPAI